MQVCAVADATDDEILAVCNQQNPAGTESGWVIVVRETAGDPAMRPVVCADDPARRHVLVMC